MRKASSMRKALSIVFIFSLLGLLSACGNDDSNSNALEVKALVQGEVSSPVAEVLVEEGYELENYTGTEDLSDYRLVIFDGDQHTPDALGSDELLLDEALDQLIPVLVTEATSDHIEQGILKHVGHGSVEDHSAYLILPYIAEDGHIEYQVVGYQLLEEGDVAELELTDFETDDPDITTPTEVDYAELPELDELNDQINREHVNDIIDRIDSNMEDRSFQNMTASTADADDIFSVGRTVPGIAGGKTQSVQLRTYNVLKTKKSKNPKISNEFDLGIKAWAYYDPNDDYYKVIVNNNNTAYVAGNNIYSRMGGRDYYLFQRGVISKISTDNTSAMIKDSSPENQNHETTYTDSVSTTVGASGSTGTGGVSISRSKTFSHSTSTTITDWSIENTSTSSQAGEWHFFQTNQSKGIRYNALPALSKYNMNCSSSTVWFIPYDQVEANNRTLTFTIETTREFGIARKDDGIFLSASYPMSDLPMDPHSFTVTLPEKPASGL